MDTAIEGRLDEDAHTRPDGMIGQMEKQMKCGIAQPL
jgi:hypothetical protein